MKHRKIAEVLVVVFFTLLALFPFRTYLLKRQVPLPFNLLVFLYSPWKYTSWPGYPLGVQNKPLGFDTLKLFYPYRKFTIDELKTGRMPLWNPYVFSGNIHEATYQSAIFYPLNIVYFMLPLMDAWTILVIIQPFLVGWFTYLFLRSLKQSPVASLVGATGFALSGWMIALWEEVLVLIHSVLWLPLALYASNLIWDQKQVKKGFFLLTLSLSFSVLAGFLQMSIYVFTSVILWNIYKCYSLADTSQKKKNFGVITAGFFSAIAISAIQWAPAFEAYISSSRGVVNAKFLFDQFLSPLSHLITFIIPDFWGNPGSYNYFSSLVYIQERTIYVGIFIFLFGFFVYFIRTKRDINFWKIFTAITLSLGFAIPTSWLWYALRVPILSVAQPARIFALSTFGLSILAGYGYDYFLEYRHDVILRSIILGLGGLFGVVWIILACLWLLVHEHSSVMNYCVGISGGICGALISLYKQKSLYLYTSITIRNFILPTLFLFVSWLCVRFFGQKRKIFATIVLGITIVGGFYYANKMLYFSDRGFEYPIIEPIATIKNISGYDRVWSYGNGYIIRNMLSYYKIFSAEGYDALYSQRYGELLYTIKTYGKWTDQINRTDVTLGEAGQNEILTDNPYRLRLMSLLGVKYVIEHKEDGGTGELAANTRFPSSLFTLVWQDEAWRIWQYKEALPRVFIVHQIKYEKQAQKIIDFLVDPKTDLRNSVVLEQDMRIQEGSAFPHMNETAEIVDYRPDRVTIQVQATASGVLFLSDTYADGWKSYIDTKPVPIVRANYAFRGVPIHSGKHTVVLVYDPLSIKVGFFMTLTGIVGVVAGLVVIKRTFI